MKTKAVGYVRVSTKEQARDGLSLEVQRERIRGYCVAHGLGLKTKQGSTWTHRQISRLLAA